MHIIDHERQIVLELNLTKFSIYSFMLLQP